MNKNKLYKSTDKVKIYLGSSYKIENSICNKPILINNTVRPTYDIRFM